MSKHDNEKYIKSPNTSQTLEQLMNIFEADPSYEFDDGGVSDYVPDDMSLPKLDDDSGYTSSTPTQTEQATGDGSFYRSNDGTSEFCSFDDVVKAPDGWHYEDPPIIMESLRPQQPLPPSEADSENSTDEAENEYEYDEYDDGPRHPILHVIGHVLLGFVTFVSILYLVGVYSRNPLITKARNTYIQTAMSTLNHKWLATAIIPPDMIADLMRLNYESETILAGRESNWGDVEVQTLPRFENETTELTGGVEVAADEEISNIQETDDGQDQLYGSPEEQTFFELFYEIDYRSMQAYVDAHPEAIANGWDKIDINEAGLSDDGTEIKTIYGDQVLAINASEGVILIRLEISLSKGVMAICKDSAKISLCPASTLGSIGQTAGRICEANNGIVAITANGFVDPDGSGNGGIISGLAVCNGVSYGSSLGGGYKRAEFRSDNHLYIVDSSSSISSETRDAAEFTPALIIDGDVVVDETSFWNAPNPRACIGQTNYLETVMVVMEGRFADSPGCSVVPVAEKMHQYGCVQAMNMDGGTSAIMYYDGEYVTRCSNENLSGGRTLPTAWVYSRND